MTRRAFLASERVQSQGGVIADVMSASIATTIYSQAETLLRETLQNACDQKVDGKKQIEFIVDAFEIVGKRKKALNDFFSDSIQNPDPLGLADLIQSSSVEALVIADADTVGLVGPVDASIDANPSNFAGFFFNVGRALSESKSGGSFGLGRTVLTTASEFSTVLVYSRFEVSGRIESRFMGMAIGPSYTFKGRKFTGRHWFGLEPSRNKGLIAPFTGNAAETLANNFELAKYLNGRTGFVALILGCSLADKSGDELKGQARRMEVVELIQDAACIYGWPHMLGGKSNRSVRFSFRVDGSEIPEKDPKKIAGLSPFVTSYEALEHENSRVFSQDITVLKSGRKETTGKLRWVNYPQTEADLDFALAGVIPLSAVALMRQANLVVKYLEVSQVADQVATRGVFKSDEEYDSFFRRAEPVAHDDWIPSKLQIRGRAQNPVKQSLSQIKETFKSVAKSDQVVATGSAAVFLGNAVGRLFDGLMVTGPAIHNESGTPGKPGAKPKSKADQLIPIEHPRVVSADASQYESVFRFQLIVADNSIGTYKLQVVTFGVLENGNPDYSPDGLEEPSIIEVQLDGRKIEVDQVFSVSQTMNYCFLEVRTVCPQGLGSTCQARLIPHE